MDSLDHWDLLEMQDRQDLQDQLVLRVNLAQPDQVLLDRLVLQDYQDFKVRQDNLVPRVSKDHLDQVVFKELLELLDRKETQDPLDH
jgi:hypothetical protein